MNVRANLRRWVGTGLIIGLLALLAAANVQAQGPEVAELVAAPAYGLASLAIHCETGILEEGDPFVSPDHVDATCPGLAAPKIQSITVTGNVSYVKVLVGDEIEHHFYLKKDGIWERFPYSPQPEWEYQYKLEQEARSMGVLDPAPQPEAAATGISVDPRGENYWNEWFARQQASSEVATADVSIDLRGESYWDEVFARQGTAVQPSAMLPSADETNSIDLYERETHLAGGSNLNTLADLFSALFGRNWAANAAGEDLSREAN